MKRTSEDPAAPISIVRVHCRSSWRTGQIEAKCGVSDGGAVVIGVESFERRESERDPRLCYACRQRLARGKRRRA